MFVPRHLLPIAPSPRHTHTADRRHTAHHTTYTRQHGRTVYRYPPHTDGHTDRNVTFRKRRGRLAHHQGPNTPTPHTHNFTPLQAARERDG
mmetsp:Transcript_50420/g.126352  ORF Transcript_50420/g.126352 Transcript_50420/m.126352 type:complete len:91 (+) Transcript_50420:230-502(+)